MCEGFKTKFPPIKNDALVPLLSLNRASANREASALI